MKKKTLTSMAFIGMLALAGCGAADTASSQSSPSASATMSPSASTKAAQSQGALELTDGWVKAGNQGMTAAFGTLTNKSDKAVKLTGASTVATNVVQLHVTEMDPNTGATQMKEAKEGFTINPGESLKMEPGGAHIMLMNLQCSLKSGATLDITVEGEEGLSQAFTFEVRDYQGAQEKYAPGEEGSMEGMDHSSHGVHGDHHDHGKHSKAADDASMAPACAQ